MRTDAIFYHLFQTLPDLFFELAEIEYSESYQFQAIELKQTAFRLDGIFVPKEADLPPQDNASLLNLLAIVIASDSKAIEMAKNLLQQPVQINLTGAVCKKSVIRKGFHDFRTFDLKHTQRRASRATFPRRAWERWRIQKWAEVVTLLLSRINRIL